MYVLCTIIVKKYFFTHSLIRTKMFHIPVNSSGSIAKCLEYGGMYVLCTIIVKKYFFTHSLIRTKMFHIPVNSSGSIALVERWTTSQTGSVHKS